MQAVLLAIFCTGSCYTPFAVEYRPYIQ